MNTERWRVLSDWHNTWLAAPTDQRAELRASFATEHPDLLQVADELAASSGAVDGFLETPALILAARDLAQDEPPLPEGTLGRTVPDRGPAGSWRHGRRLPGDRSAARSRRRAQDADQRGARRWARGRAVPAGSADHRLARPPEHRQGVRRGDVERSAVPGLGTARRRDLASADRQRAGRSGRRARHRLRADERPGGRARARAGPSRSQAREHLPDQIRHREDPGLRHREACAGSRTATRSRDAHRGRPRHRRLSGTRAGQRRSGRCADGPVRARLDSLRVDDGTAGLRARAHDRYAPCDRPRRSARPPARAAPR